MSVVLISKTVSSDRNCIKSDSDESWEKQLKEMNYLIIEISSVNIINGLFFTQSQSEAFLKLAKKFETPDIPLLDTTGNASKDLVNIRRTYVNLLQHLLTKTAISDSLKNQVLSARVLEAEIIKKSLLGAKTPGYNGTGCMQCHASPAHFPINDISNTETSCISVEQRAEIDKMHVIGLFGNDGMMNLWNMKSDVDTILTDGQRYIMKGFRCCLVPSKSLSDPTNIGQAAVSDDWLKYFRDVRDLSDVNWKKYKQLYILPLEDIVEGTLPGIKAKDKKVIMNKAEAVINDARKMDEVDFELQKENLCKKLKAVLNVDNLNGETTREREGRQFISAMFLIFPGSTDLYKNIVNPSGNKK